jgi:hypothetical protein
MSAFNSYYNWMGVIPYASNGTTECITAAGGDYATPIPANVVLPTRQVGPLDAKDPRGLTYCYHGGSDAPVEDKSFWSLFSDDILGALHNESNCEQFATAVSPNIIVDQATLLLETTTEFIGEQASKSPPSTKTSSTPTNVLVDPFFSSSQSEEEQKPSFLKSNTEASFTSASASPTIVKPTQTKPAPDRTASATKQSLKASAASADHQTSPSKDDNKSGSSKSHSTRPTAPTDESSDSRVPESTAPTNQKPGSGDISVVSPTTAQLEVLNSLIQAVGQHQSSVEHAAPGSQDTPTVTFGGDTATPDSEGPAITISGTQISLASDASAIVIGSSTSVLVASGSSGDRVKSDDPVPFLTLTANPSSASGYVVGDQTIQPGGPAITISGTPVSLDSQATAVVVGSSIKPIAIVSYEGDRSQPAGAQSTGQPASLSTLAGTIAALSSASEYIVADQTLITGGTPITVSGTPISLAPQTTAVVVGSSTSILVTASRDGDQTQQIGKLASMLTLAGVTATLDSASDYVVGGQTLTPGENAVTVSGTRISLASHATAVVIGSTTSVLPSALSNIGDYVWAGIAGVLAAAEASSTTSPKASDTKSGSEVSTASDGEVIVVMASTAEPTSSSQTGSSSSSAGSSSLESGETSSTSSSSSAGASDVASAASFPKSVADLTALILWVGIVAIFGV